MTCQPSLRSLRISPGWPAQTSAPATANGTINPWQGMRIESRTLRNSQGFSWSQHLEEKSVRSTFPLNLLSSGGPGMDPIRLIEKRNFCVSVCPSSTSLSFTFTFTFTFTITIIIIIIIINHDESPIIMSALPCLLHTNWKPHSPSGSFLSSFFLGVELSTVCSRERCHSTRRTLGDFCPMPSMAPLLRCRYSFSAAVGDVELGNKWRWLCLCCVFLVFWCKGLLVVSSVTRIGDGEVSQSHVSHFVLCYLPSADFEKNAALLPTINSKSLTNSNSNHSEKSPSHPLSPRFLPK